MVRIHVECWKFLLSKLSFHSWWNICIFYCNSTHVVYILTDISSCHWFSLQWIGLLRLHPQYNFRLWHHVHSIQRHNSVMLVCVISTSASALAPSSPIMLLSTDIHYNTKGIHKSRYSSLVFCARPLATSITPTSVILFSARFRYYIDFMGDNNTVSTLFLAIACPTAAAPESVSSQLSNHNLSD